MKNILVFEKKNLDKYNKYLLKKYNTLTFTLEEKIKRYSDSIYKSI